MLFFFFLSFFFLNPLNEPGPNWANISQQLVELKKELLEEIKATKRNETKGNCDKGL